MTLSDFQGRSPIAGLLKSDISYSYAAVDKISTDIACLSRFLGGSSSLCGLYVRILCELYIHTVCPNWNVAASQTQIHFTTGTTPLDRNIYCCNYNYTNYGRPM